MDFLCKFDEHLWVPFWELLAVTGRLLGVLGLVHGASRSGQILSVRTYVHPSASFFFWSRFWSNEMELRSKKREKDIQKSDIALITSSRSSTFDAHLQISYDPFEGFTISSAFAGGATCPAGSF